MNKQATRAGPSFRTLLVLGRTSNLPTVWSNCLAGWLIAGGGRWERLVLLCLGASSLYLGGMFLNDAFDIDFDRQHRPERPIPSGAISLRAVLILGCGWLLSGVLCISFLGQAPVLVALLLAIAIVVYDAIHKILVLAPILMALCRFLLVLMASASGLNGIVGLSIWSALVLAGYIIGLSYLARKESTPGPLQYWPCVFLASPIVLALIVNQGSYQKRAAMLAAILVLWLFRSLRFLYWYGHPNVGRTVSSLLAGIVLVDLLATGGLTAVANLTFAVLFLLAILFQRLIPAT